MEACDCCGARVYDLPFWRASAGVAGGIRYCTKCYEARCDLKDVCVITVERNRQADARPLCHDCGRKVGLLSDGTFVSHDRDAWIRQLCPGSFTKPLGPPTDEELAETYRSLGVPWPQPDAQRNQDQEDDPLWP